MKYYAKRQHYVPQFLLRYFSSTSSDYLFVFDKQTGKIRRQKIKELAHENYFNEAPYADRYVVSYDEKFQYVENFSAPVIAKINSGTTIPSLSPMELADLYYFVAIQYLRTPAKYSFGKQLNELMRKRFPNMTDSLRRQIGPLTDDSAKQFSLHSVFASADVIVRELVMKRWAIFEPSERRTFYIGDSPVVLHNDLKDKYRSTLGFAVAGIEIYLPLSATTVLAGFCLQLASLVGRAEPFASAFEMGKPISCGEPNVDFLNSLQVVHSERFVFCQNDDFALAQSILANHPGVRNPVRVEMANYAASS